MKLLTSVLEDALSVYTFIHALFSENKKAALAAATLASLITLSNEQTQAQNTTSHLGPFEEQLRINNPLREPFNFNFRPAPTAIDIDNDGDTDVVVADYDGGNGFHLLRNDGTPTSPAFNKALYTTNPFGFTAFDDGGTLAFTDIDADGDLDMLFGTIDGTFRFYKRTAPTGLAWTLQNSVWNTTTKAGNPMFGIDLGDFTSPVFKDMDNDGDLDLVIGSSYLPANKSMHYYVNDGQFNFSPSALTGINPNLAEATPTFIDIDNDGNEDLVIGAADGQLYYFKRTGATSFEQQLGMTNPFHSFYHGAYSSPSAADFDNDGDKDLIVGFNDNLLDFAYIENKGNGVFEEKTSFDNPFGGASVISASAPYFVDEDGDGDKDMVIGSSDNSDPYLRYFKNENGKYVEVIANNPFSGATLGIMVVPSFVDIDGDGDRDLLSTVDNGDMTFIEHFKNEGGAFIRQNIIDGPFADVYVSEGRGDFADIDKDGDYDFIATDRRWQMGDYRYFIRYFENTGTTTAAAFTERTDAANPLNVVLEEFALFPRFYDVDHDGDLDALIGEGGGVVENTDGNEFHFYENISTTNAPVFKYRGNLTEQGRNPNSPMPSFVDQDGDGDLDIFFGTSGGELIYYKNINPAAVVTLNTNAITVPTGSSVIIDPLLTLTDADSDSIVFAQVSISSFTAGQAVLEFIPEAGITGTYNSSTGKLTFSGKAPLVSYQTLLRSVSVKQLNEAPTNGRKKDPSPMFATVTKTVSIQIADADRTTSLLATRTVNFISSSAPVFADHTIAIPAGSSTTIDLKTLISDANNDVDFNTLAITQLPSSGTATVNASGVLTLNFASVSFSGSTTVTLSVCDAEGLCDQAVVSINVTNTAPVFANTSVSGNSGNILTIDVKSLISDNENNVDLSTLAVVGNPSSGAMATLDATKNLVVNYQSLPFTGSETVNLTVCDLIGACATSTITLNIVNTAPVFNSTTVSVPYHGSTTINLSTLISDLESNQNLNSLTIVTGSKIGGAVALTGTTLSISYASINMAGNDNIQLRVCDGTGSCSESTITVTIQNAPPVIQPETVSTRQGVSKSLNLLEVTSDADGNLDLSTFSITQAPVSGASAQIEVISANEVRLTINYSGITFSGNDRLTIRACDEVGACTENIISIEVNSEIEIYNAIAPNSSGDNKFFRILNLPSENKVTIFNRWGDVVYHVDGYDNGDVKFEGNSDSGNALTSGTYLYKIEYVELSGSRKTLTGYLSLKQ